MNLKNIIKVIEWVPHDTFQKKFMSKEGKETFVFEVWLNVYNRNFPKVRTIQDEHDLKELRDLSIDLVKCKNLSNVKLMHFIDLKRG